MSNIKRQVIAISDNEQKNFYDKVKTKSIPYGGFVSIVDKKTGELLVDKKEFKLIDDTIKGKDNLIVWSGREIVPQKLFNVDRISGSNEKDLFICWFGLGTGGADPLDPLNPISPDSSDTALNNEIVIDSSDPLNADGGRKKPFDANIEFLQDTANGSKWLISKATITINDTDANGNDLSEAMLYLADTNDASTVTTFKAWARVTFSTIRKDSDRELIFLWFVYF